MILTLWKPSSNNKLFFFIVIVCTLDLVQSFNETLRIHHPNAAIDLSIFGTRTFRGRITTYSNANPEEIGPYFEGDILVRNGIIGENYRWPNAIVPYEIKGHYTTRELLMLFFAFIQFRRRTCIRFRPRRNADEDYIAIVDERPGCWSYIGRAGGRQEVNLESHQCFRKIGTSMHELMHSIGFLHEQNRSERDDYVRVISENIIPDMIHNFAKYGPQTIYPFGVPYDYASVMHYTTHSFTVNGKPTLVALHDTPEARRMGQRNGFSSGDIAKINAMYGCRRN